MKNIEVLSSVVKICFGSWNWAWRKKCSFSWSSWKIVMLDRRGYLRKTEFLSKNMIKMTWATPGFQNFTWEVTLCAAATPKHAMVTIENFFRWKQMIWLCGTYFYFENHQYALVKLDRKNFHKELVEKSCSGCPLHGPKSLAISAHQKKRTIDIFIYPWYSP